MSRNRRSKTTREAPREGRLRPARLEPATRQIDVAGASPAAQAAGALSQAFGAGAEAFQAHTIHREREGFRQAVTDYAAGSKDEREAERNRGYFRAWAQLDAENDLRRAKAELEQTLLEVDFAGMDPEDRQQFISEFQQERFALAERDPEYAQHIAQGLIAMEAEVLERFAQEDIDNIREQQHVRLFENLTGRLQETGKFDYDYLAEMTGILNLTGEEKTNAYARTLFSAAISEGRPDLIDDMPDRYPNGQPTIKNNPRWADRILNARRQADAVARENMKEALDAEALAASQAAEAAERELFLMTARGEDPNARAAQFVAEGVMDVEKARAAIRFADSQAGSGTGVSHEVLAELRWRFSVEPTSVSQQDIRELYVAGAFGPPGTDESVAMFDEMLKARDSAMRNLPTDPHAKARRTELAGLTGPVGSARITAQWDPEIAARQTRALAAYDQSILAGQPPEQAFEAGLQAYQQAGGTRPTDAAPATMEISASLLGSGQLSPDRFTQQMRAQGWDSHKVLDALEAANVPGDIIDHILGL